MLKEEKMNSIKRILKFNSYQQGFTLIEILIVVMVLGILAMVIVPQISVSTKDAKESTLSTNIVAFRNAVELYYHQHDNVYPGANTILGATGADAAAAKIAFSQQLTQYTEADGTVAAVKSGTAKFGPYLKTGVLPTNPFNDLADVLCDVAEDDITVRTSNSATAWKFYTITGNLIANDGAHTDL
jgi:prepilin-type N-terminal cleavage/methylation domain-containing protein